MVESSLQIVKAYYDAFNRADWPGMCERVHPEVVHDINQGETEIGRDPFARFLDNMARSYDEKIEDLQLMVGTDPSRVAAEFYVRGRYVKHAPGMPDSRGQTYHLRCGAFFDVSEGLITRVTTYYNLYNWLRMVRR